MRKAILANYDEPTDAELSALMLEVAQEAKRKALIAQKELAETVARKIRKAQEKFKAKQL